MTERDPSQRVVITGMGVASCFGQDPEEYYQQLLKGTSGVSMIEKFDASNMSTQFAAYIKDYDVGEYIDRKNARRMDDCLKYAVVSSRQALERAGLDNAGLDTLDKKRCGVLVGSGMGGLTVFQDGVKNHFTSKKGHKAISPFFIPYAITNMGGAMVGMDLGFMGPNYSISTACATANYCFTAAADHIKNGHADLIVAGGVEAPVIPTGIGGFIACRALSSNNEEFQSASRPWDKKRDGFVMGEGAGVLVMESLEHAMQRGAPIVAEYLGGGVNCDAHHMTEPRQDGLGVSGCIELALDDAGITEREQVNYINCHATSTPAGDVAEVLAVKKVFTAGAAREGLHMNGTKSMIGHALGAAGGLEAVACLKALEHGELHPTMNCDDPEEVISDIDCVLGKSKKVDVTAAMSNSFGFGGHNSSVIFGPYKE